MFLVRLQVLLGLVVRVRDPTINKIDGFTELHQSADLGGFQQIGYF